MNKLVSVIIPTYNVERFIHEAVDSILNQSYKNLEIIIVDDCSSDNTFLILKDYEQKFSNVKVFQNEKNSKISYSLNKCLEHSSGDYIARMDGDDISYPDRIQKQVDYLESHPEIDLIGTDLLRINESGEPLGLEIKCHDEVLIRKTLLLASPAAHPSWLGRKSIFTKMNGYREIAPAEDYDFLLRMRTSGHRFTNMNFTGIKLRIREGNTASSQGLIQRKTVNYALDLYKERKASGKDSFSKTDFEKMKSSVQPKDVEKYKESLVLFFKAAELRSQKNILCLYYYLLSALKSKYQFQFLTRGFTFLLIKKIQRL